MEKLLQGLGITEVPEALAEDYPQAMAEYDKNGAYFLSDEFFDCIQDKWQIFDCKIDFVKRHLKRVREDDLLARFSFLLKRMLDGAVKEKRNVGLPQIPKFDDPQRTTDSDMAAFFAMLAFAPNWAQDFEKRGVPKNIITNTLKSCYQESIEVHNLCFGRDGFELARCFSWNQLYLHGSILRVGIFNFEMKKDFTEFAVVYANNSGEYKLLVNNQDVSADGQITGCVGHSDVAYHAELTEDKDFICGYAVDTYNNCVIPEKIRLDAREWKAVLRKDDSVISVHIPACVDLSNQNVQDSYKEYVQIHKKCFPDFAANAFVCFSWLLDPQLRCFTKEDSNIIKFQSQFMRIPNKSTGRAVFPFLFRKGFRYSPVADELEKMPENTSLQRAVKKFYLEGNYIHEPGGVFFEYLK